MEKMELVENVGYGIKRMRDAMRKYGLESPLIEAGESWFRITFRRKPQHASLTGDTRKTEQKGISGLVEKVGGKVARNPRQDSELDARESGDLQERGGRQHRNQHDCD